MALNRSVGTGAIASKKVATSGNGSVKASGIPSVTKPVAKSLDRSLESGHKLSAGLVADGKSVSGNLLRSKPVAKEKSSVPGRLQPSGCSGTVAEAGAKTGLKPPTTTAAVHSINGNESATGKVSSKTAVKSRQSSPKLALSGIVASEHHKKLEIAQRVSSLPQPAAGIPHKMGAKAPPGGGMTAHTRAGLTASSARRSSGGSSIVKNGTVSVVKGRSPPSSSNVTSEPKPESQKTRKTTGIAKLQGPVVGRASAVTGNSLKAKSMLPSVGGIKTNEVKPRSNVDNSKSSIIGTDINSNLNPKNCKKIELKIQKVHAGKECVLHKFDNFSVLQKSDCEGNLVDEETELLIVDGQTYSDTAYLSSSSQGASSISIYSSQDMISKSFEDVAEDSSECDRFSETKSDLLESTNDLLSVPFHLRITDDMDDEMTGELVIETSSSLRCADANGKSVCISTDDIFASCEDITEHKCASDVVVENADDHSTVDSELGISNVAVLPSEISLSTGISNNGGCLKEDCSDSTHGGIKLAVHEEWEEEIYDHELKITEDDDKPCDGQMHSSVNREQEEFEAMEMITGYQMPVENIKDLCVEIRSGEGGAYLDLLSDLCGDDVKDDLSQDTGNQCHYLNSPEDKISLHVDENENVNVEGKEENGIRSSNGDKNRCHYEDTSQHQSAIGEDIESHGENMTRLTRMDDFMSSENDNLDSRDSMASNNKGIHESGVDSIASTGGHHNAGDVAAVSNKLDKTDSREDEVVSDGCHLVYVDNADDGFQTCNADAGLSDEALCQSCETLKFDSDDDNGDDDDNDDHVDFPPSETGFKADVVETGILHVYSPTAGKNGTTHCASKNLFHLEESGVKTQSIDAKVSVDCIPEEGTCETVKAPGIGTLQHPDIQVEDGSSQLRRSLVGRSSQGSCFSVGKQCQVGLSQDVGDDSNCRALTSSDVISSLANYAQSHKHHREAFDGDNYNKSSPFYQDVDQNRVNNGSVQLSSAFINEFAVNKLHLRDPELSISESKQRTMTDSSTAFQLSLSVVKEVPGENSGDIGSVNGISRILLKTPCTRDKVDSTRSSSCNTVSNHERSETGVAATSELVLGSDRVVDQIDNPDLVNTACLLSRQGNCNEEIPSKSTAVNFQNISSEVAFVTSKESKVCSIPTADNDDSAIMMKPETFSVINQTNVQNGKSIHVTRIQDLDRSKTVEVRIAQDTTSSDTSTPDVDNSGRRLLPVDKMEPKEVSPQKSQADESSQNSSTTASLAPTVNHSFGIRKDVHCLQRAPSPLRVLTNHMPVKNETPKSSPIPSEMKTTISSAEIPQPNILKFRPVSVQDYSGCSSNDSLHEESSDSLTIGKINEKNKLIKDANHNVVEADVDAHLPPPGIPGFLSSRYVPSRPLSQFCSRTMGKSMRRNIEREGNSGLSSVESLPAVHSTDGESGLSTGDTISDISAQIRFARSCSRMCPKSPSHLTGLPEHFSSTPKVIVSGSLPSFEMYRSPSGRTFSSAVSLSSSRTNSSRQSLCSTPVISNGPSPCSTPTMMGSSDSTIEPDFFTRTGLGIIYSGASKYQNSDEDVHGSYMSLASMSSSVFSSADEKQAMEMRKLRQELEVAKEKIESLTTQLNVNTVMSKTYEQNVESLTQRLKQLATIIDQKESELCELRSAMRNLSNSPSDNSLQTIPDCISLSSNFVRKSPFSSTLPLEARNSGPRCGPVLTRHMSCESVNSLNSQSSSCSMGSQQSTSIYSDKKKKSKKSWLKNSISKAFSRKKTKQGEFDALSIHSDNSNTDPLVIDCSATVPISKTPPDGTQLFLESGSTEELQEKLREADNQLTELRLESLASIQLIEQLQENISSLEQEVVSLKAENKSLQRIILQQGTSSAGNQASQKRFAEMARHASLCGSSSTLMPSSISVDGLSKLNASPVAAAAAQNCSSPKLLHKFSLSVANDSLCKQFHRICVYVAGVVCGGNSEEEKNEKSLRWIGALMLTEKMSWQDLDMELGNLFLEHIHQLDPESGLGLDEKSIISYQIGDHRRTPNSESADSLPAKFVPKVNANIRIYLRGWQEDSVDFLAFDTLVPRPFLQQYVSLLLENRRLLFCGPSLTGKTFLSKKLARHLVLRKEKKLSSNSIAQFTVDSKSSKELEQYLSNIVVLCEQASNRLPSVIVIDNLHLADNLSKAFSGFFSLDTQSCPYIIGTMTQSRAASLTCLQFHQNFRWVLFNLHEEPVKSFLARFLRRQWAEKQFDFDGEDDDCSLQRIVDWMPRVWHHVNRFVASTCTADKCIGPGIFLPCPSDTKKARAWFVDLWNYSIGPYLLQLIKDSFSQGSSNRNVFKDPTDWVLETSPWANTKTDNGSLPLLRLLPYHDSSSVAQDQNQTSNSGKQFSQTSSDPLLDMLRHLQVSTCFPDSISTDANNVSSLSSYGGISRLNATPTTLHSVTS